MTSPDLNSPADNDLSVPTARARFWWSALIAGVVVFLLGLLGIWKSNNFTVVERLDLFVCSGTIDGEPLVAELNFQPKKDTLALIAFADGRHWSLTAHRVEDGQHRWSLLDPTSNIAGTLQGDWNAATGRFRGELRYATPRPATAKVELNRLATFERTTQVWGLRIGPFGQRFKSTFLIPRFPSDSPFRNLAQSWFGAEPLAIDWQDQLILQLDLLLSNVSIRDEDYTTQLSVISADPTVISAKYFTHDDSGGAHGNWSNLLETWIAEDADATTLAIEDCLNTANETPNWKPLNELIYRHLNAEKTKRGIEHFTPPNPELTDVPECTFAFEPVGLRVNFVPYAVGAYAEGEYEFLIPWSEVRPVFRPDSPVQRFWK